MEPASVRTLNRHGLAMDIEFAGACDCHTHVFEDPSRFPLAAARTYTPQQATHAQLAGYLHALRLSRVVVVQPSVYGLDNSATLHAMAQLGPEVARGVAAVDIDAVTQAELDRLHAAGMRGVRLNLETDRVGRPEDAKRLLRRCAERIGGRGWHIQVHARLALLDELRDVLPQLETPVVLDHYAGTHASTRPTDPAFARLLHLLECGRVYVKLSAGHLCGVDGDDFEPLAPLARALIGANPERLVWGSDWPHPDPGHGLVDAAQVRPLRHVHDGGSVALVRRCAADEAQFRTIMAANPGKLYGFAPAS